VVSSSISVFRCQYFSSIALLVIYLCALTAILPRDFAASVSETFVCVTYKNVTEGLYLVVIYIAQIIHSRSIFVLKCDLHEKNFAQPRALSRCEES
jgi:hypothetical protein